jgi:hypothetical protein
MLKRVRQVSGKEFTDDDKGETNATELAKEALAVADRFKNFNATKNTQGATGHIARDMYEMRLIDDITKIPAAVGTSRPALKQEYKFAMQKLLRGDDEGVMNQVDPLIPIDFEMEIDGTGGLFPGNSFQSTYLPKRYREEALLQMTKVNHKISSDGWSVTIKGQMRAVSNFAEKLAKSKVKKEKTSDGTGEEDKRKRNLDLGKKLEKERGNMNPASAIKLLDTGFKPKTAGSIKKNLPSNQTNYREMYPSEEAYREANVEFKGNEAVRLNAVEKIKQEKTSINTLTFLQNQFNSGNTDWAQDASIVTQLQQTIQDFGYPNLPEWWGDGDFGPGTQEILGNFLNQQQFGDTGGMVLSELALDYLYRQGE